VSSYRAVSGRHAERLRGPAVGLTARPIVHGILRTWATFHVHVLWSREAVWIPLADTRVGIDWENHTSHPGPGQILIYPGGFSECEIIVPYGACSFASKVGPLAGNHFATIASENGWRSTLTELGRRCLWEGAQTVEIAEAD